MVVAEAVTGSSRQRGTGADHRFSVAKVFHPLCTVGLSSSIIKMQSSDARQVWGGRA